MKVLERVESAGVTINPQKCDLQSNAQSCTDKDPVCQLIREYIKSGWPTKNSVRGEIAPYWKATDFITECKQLLMYKGRIVVTKSLQRDFAEDSHWSSRHRTMSC